MIEIIPVSGKRLMRTFVLFPFSLYKGNACWVPPLLSDEFFTLDPKRNPAFEYSEAALWLARKDGKIVGRIAGIISRSYIEKWGNRYARFGWIDFIDDREVSAALMRTVEDWARAHQLEAVHGPLGFCDLDKEGMLVDGFDQIGSFITIYNHPYYKDHLEALGYVKDAEWIEWDIRLPDKDPAGKLSQLAGRARQKYSLRALELKKPKDIIPWVPEIFRLLNVGYEKLYGVVPITEKQVQTYVKQFFSFVNVHFLCVLLDAKDEVAGFGISIPSLSNAARKSRGRLFPFGFLHFLRAIRHNDTLDLYLVAVRPELKKTGAPFILLDEITRNAHRYGIVRAIASPELETNTAVHSLWHHYDAHIHRRRRAYIRHI